MRSILVATLSCLIPLALAQERTAAPADAEVYLISPKDGETVRAPFTVRFGLKGMGVAPAGVKYAGSGHHHLLVDTEPPANADLPLPATDRVLHFGRGQTETTLTLPAGKHTLQLLLADHNHVPHAPPVISRRITVMVVE